MNISEKLSQQRQEQRLKNLQSGLLGGIFAEKKRKENEEKLKNLLQNALFLEEDETRKQNWIAKIPKLSDSMLLQMIEAVIRENFRYKKKERNLVVELNRQLPIHNFR